MPIRPGWGKACVAERSDPQLAPYLFRVSNIRLVVVVLRKKTKIISLAAQQGMLAVLYPMSGRERQLQLVERANNLVDELGRVFPERVYWGH